jgi:hypothetical protein
VAPFREGTPALREHRATARPVEEVGERAKPGEDAEAGEEGIGALEDLAGVRENENILSGAETAQGREYLPGTGVLMGDEGEVYEGGLAGDPVLNGTAKGAVTVVEDMNGLERLRGEELELGRGGFHGGGLSGR